MGFMNESIVIIFSFPLIHYTKDYLYWIWHCLKPSIVIIEGIILDGVLMILLLQP